MSCLLWFVLDAMYLQCDHARWIICPGLGIRDIAHLSAIDPCLNSWPAGEDSKFVPVAVHHRVIANQVFFGSDPGAVALV